MTAGNCRQRPTNRPRRFRVRSGGRVYLIACAIVFAISSSIIPATSAFRTSLRRRPSTALGIVASGPPPPNNLRGKVAYQRFLYKLSTSPSHSNAPEKNSPFCMEERVRFRVGGDDGRDLIPVELKTFLLREDPPPDDDGAQPPDDSKTYQRVGRVVHRLDVHEVTTDTDDGLFGDGTTPESYAAGLGGTVWDSSVVSTLFFASRPELMRGNVLEPGCGVGFGGIMSCIAAGAAIESARGDAGGGGAHQTECDDGGLPAPVPPRLLEGLTLADFNREVLRHASRNVESCGLPASTVDLTELDWTVPVPIDMNCRYDLIIGNDIAYDSSDVGHISRLVAGSLNKASPHAHFVHIGPSKRDAIADLGDELRRRYKMDLLDVTCLELRRYDLVPMILDSVEEEASAEVGLMGREEGGAHGFVEFQNQSNQKFSCLIAAHRRD